MQLVLIDGIMGAGKTMAMTLLANWFADLSSNFVSRPALFSNYGAANSKEFNNFNDFIDVAAEEHSLILLDESHIELDARSSTSNSVKYFTHLIFYFRKLHTTMFLTTPDIENLDGRVLRVASLYIKASKQRNYFYYEFYDIQTGKFLRSLKLPKSIAFEYVANLYDTEAIVTPLIYPESKAEYSALLSNLKITADKRGAGRRHPQGMPQLGA